MSVLRQDLAQALERKDLQDRACRMIVAACAVHIILFVVVSTFILYGIKSTLYGDIPELVERGIPELWESAFLTVTAFVNCGLTITSDSMHSYRDKPGVYLFVSVIILAGKFLVSSRGLTMHGVLVRAFGLHACLA
jgi:Trk-type K+ transport system membrane component